jgi:hypothetical protein
VTEDLLDRLVAAVRGHYVDDDTPLLLSRLAQANKELLAELKGQFGNLKAAIRAAAEDRLRIADQRPGRETVVLGDLAPMIEQKGQEPSADQNQSNRGRRAEAASAWLLTWNPKKWNWAELQADRDSVIDGKPVRHAWRCASTHSKEGDPAYLMRLGVEPKGIVAYGTIVRGSYEGRHHDEQKTQSGKMMRYVDVKFSGVRDADRDRIVPLDVLKERVTEQHWEPFGSGIKLNSPALEVLGELWRALPEIQGRNAASATIVQGSKMASPNTTPRNLILYGPPGTGKTFSTTAEAVRLCDGALPEDGDDAAVRRRYRELVNAKQVYFVTFHQSYSYEDFVEGLRPTTREDDVTIDTEASGASPTAGGFRLEPVAGVFREIATLAEQARKSAAEGRRGNDFDLAGRRFWKMGIGAVGSEEHVYRAAIAGNYVVLGWGQDVNWTDSRFASLEEMRKEWAKRYPDDKTPSQTSQPWVLRNKIDIGDLVIVPYGNSAFRAIAEVQGDYYFELSEDGTYNQRRKVRWLLTLDEPLPLDTIIEGNFTMRALYEILEHRVRKEALIRLVSRPQDGHEPTPPDQFVLIIDEINRADISKVFGELITLIEPDKRIGGDCEIKATLPYSKTSFGVPDNLHIVGTMNTADRSIALLDTALRRRFTFRELMPQPELLSIVGGIQLARLLTAINDRIEYLFDREHQIGHAFFMRCQSRADVDEVMRRRVIPLLAEYFFDDWNKLAVVLGDADEGEGDREGGFLDRRQLKVPTGLGSDGEAPPRYRWKVRDTFDYANLQ